MDLFVVIVVALVDLVDGRVVHDGEIGCVSYKLGGLLSEVGGLVMKGIAGEMRLLAFFPLGGHTQHSIVVDAVVQAA